MLNGTKNYLTDSMSAHSVKWAGNGEVKRLERDQLWRCPGSEPERLLRDMAFLCTRAKKSAPGALCCSRWDCIAWPTKRGTQDPECCLQAHYSTVIGEEKCIRGRRKSQVESSVSQKSGDRFAANGIFAACHASRNLFQVFENSTALFFFLSSLLTKENMSCCA